MSRICDMQVAAAGQVSVWVNGREHCGPHVHCSDKMRTWEGRIRFSFVDNVATFWDCLTPTCAPDTEIFDEIIGKLTQRLGQCRSEWWRLHAGTIGCCLMNAVHPDEAGVPRRVRRAEYDSASDSTELTFVNGHTVRVNLR